MDLVGCLRHKVARLVVVKVLIVDDDPNARFLLELLCKGEAFTPVFAGGGHDALARLGQGDIAVLVTDVQMPDFSGEQLLDRVKQEHPDVPVVMMTGSPSIEDAVRFLKRGADWQLSSIQRPW